MSRFASAAARTKCPNAVSKASRSLLRRGGNGRGRGQVTGQKDNGAQDDEGRRREHEEQRVEAPIVIDDGDHGQ